MRVLVASHLFPSERRPGDAPWLAEQVCALRAAGVETEVLCCSATEPDHTGTVESAGCVQHVTYRSVSAGPLNGDRMGLLLSALRYRRKLADHLGQGTLPDLIHAHFAFPDGWAAAQVGARFGVPVVLTVHGSDVARVVSRRGWFGERVRAGLRLLDAVITVSDRLGDEMRAALPEIPTHTIPNGFNESLFFPGSVERDLGFLFVGALIPVKNVELLVEAYLSDRRLHALPLTIIGDGPLRDRLERMIREAPPTASVTLLGSRSREQVAAAMRRARALVVPSEREGFGVVAAEALACGTPVVGSRVGGLPEILAGPEAGILVDPGDRTQLTRAMNVMLDWGPAPDEVSRASGAAPWSRRARELVALYHETLPASPTGVPQ